MSLDKWKREIVGNIITHIGVSRGWKILDFGCGPGNYTIPVSRVVGKKGSIYALDENEEDLNRLISEAKSKGLENIKKLEASAKSRISLDTGSIDMVMLYDILHYYLFSRRKRQVAAAKRSLPGIKAK